jgi:hypothetical protein
MEIIIIVLFLLLFAVDWGKDALEERVREQSHDWQEFED